MKQAEFLRQTGVQLASLRHDLGGAEAAGARNLAVQSPSCSRESPIVLAEVGLKSILAGSESWNDQFR